jgi:hypothetical protein
MKNLRRHSVRNSVWVLFLGWSVIFWRVARAVGLDRLDCGCPTLSRFLRKGGRAAPECFVSAKASLRGVVNQ